MRALVLFFFASLALSCSDDDSASTPGQATSRCVVNQQISCPCPGASSDGIQVCQENGSYSTCQCPSGAGGSSGTSGQAGGDSGGASAGSTAAGGGGAGGSAGAGAGGVSGGAGGVGGEAGSNAGGSAGNAGASASGAGGQGGSAAGGEAGQGGSTAGQGGSSGGAGGCTGPSSVEAAPARPALMIVMDRSGSTTDSGRYEAMKSAIQGFIGAAAPDTLVGLMRFPEGTFDDSALANCIFSQTPECQAIWADNGCKDIASPPNVPTATVSSSKDAILSLLNTTTPTGGTPTRWALKTAWSSLLGIKAAGGRHVILISDGTPTVFTPGSSPIPDSGVECGSEQQILQEAKAMAESNDPVFTHAIGMPAEELQAGQWLSVLAAASGTAPAGCNSAQAACHHKGPTGDSIQKALEQITTTAPGCRYELPAGVAPGFSVEVVSPSGSALVPQDKQHQNGWDLDEKNPGYIRIHGPTCTMLQQNPTSSKVNIVLSCG